MFYKPTIKQVQKMSENLGGLLKLGGLTQKQFSEFTGYTRTRIGEYCAKIRTIKMPDSTYILFRYVLCEWASEHPDKLLFCKCLEEVLKEEV